MGEKVNSHSYTNAHVAWLVCLYIATWRVRREGLMSIEGDVENAEQPTSLFGRFPQVQQGPYLEFATDVLRMMLNGTDSPEDMSVYAESYISGATAGNGSTSGAPDATIFRTIWLTLWASMKGYAPQAAVEFGRQAIPAGLKPSFLELEELVRKANREIRDNGAQQEGGLDAAVDDFMASLSKAR
ncbi:MAG TPA: hypothetical protein VF816_18475 [Rhodocyclaceae bacterium]